MSLKVTEIVVAVRCSFPWLRGVVEVELAEAELDRLAQRLKIQFRYKQVLQ